MRAMIIIVLAPLWVPLFVALVVWDIANAVRKVCSGDTLT